MQWGIPWGIQPARSGWFGLREQVASSRIGICLQSTEAAEAVLLWRWFQMASDETSLKVKLIQLGSVISIFNFWFWVLFVSMVWLGKPCKIHDGVAEWILWVYRETLHRIMQYPVIGYSFWPLGPASCICPHSDLCLWVYATASPFFLTLT